MSIRSISASSPELSSTGLPGASFYIRPWSFRFSPLLILKLHNMTSVALPALELCCLIMDKLTRLSALVSPHSMCPLGLYSWSRGVEGDGETTSIVSPPRPFGEGLELSLFSEWGVESKGTFAFCLSVSFSRS